MTSAPALPLRIGAGLHLDWLLAALLTGAALFLYINSAFFSSYSAVHVDLSVNLTAAHAIRDGANPYGETVLKERAQRLHSPTNLIYETLFTSYIQPPTSALSLMPLTVLPWRDATRVYLVVNNVFLWLAVGLTLVTVRPTLSRRWAVAGATVIVAGFSQVYASFALGQVDATMTLLLVLGFWGHSRGRPEVSGAAIAAGTAIKLVPAVLLLYFLWKREYRVVAWAVGIGAALFLLGLAAAGVDTWKTYFTDTLPALMKGSTHYQNMALSGVWDRLFVKRLGFFGPYLSLEEVPGRTGARVLSLLSGVTIVAALAAVIPRGAGGRRGATGPADGALVVEYYLVVAAGLLVSSVGWEFYSVWLLPLFLGAFLAPDRVLPEKRWVRLALLAGLAVAYVGFNYPGGRIGKEYFFDANSFFYHPAWLPAAWLEEGGYLGFGGLHLYGKHLTLVPLLRLGSLLLFAATLGFAVIAKRQRHRLAGEPAAELQPAGP